VHVQASHGEKVDDDEFFKADFPHCMDERQLTVKKEGLWYTAGYYDEEEKKNYYAERGPSSQMSEQARRLLVP
jgi:hypothetical protein